MLTHTAIVAALLSAPPAWEKVIDHAAFSPRDSAKPLVYQGKMWLGNGYYHGNKLSRDLWSSTDGKTWTLVNPATPYDGYSELVAYKDRMWAIKQSVWHSTDGVTWTKVADKTPFGAAHKVVVHEDRMWQLAGGAGVWNSTDGVHWTCVNPRTPFAGRSSCSVLIFNGQFWILGGCISKPNDPPEKGYPKITTCNDVWSSPDGVTWTRVLEHAPWSPRMWLGGAAYAGRLWVIGGYDNVHHANLGDVWTSSDGADWDEFRPAPAFSPRHEPSCFIYQGSLWLVAGNSWPVRNDVWRLTLPEGLEPQR